MHLFVMTLGAPMIGRNMAYPRSTSSADWQPLHNTYRWLDIAYTYPDSTCYSLNKKIIIRHTDCYRETNNMWYTHLNNMWYTHLKYISHRDHCARQSERGRTLTDLGLIRASTCWYFQRWKIKPQPKLNKRKITPRQKLRWIQKL